MKNTINLYIYVSITNQNETARRADVNEDQEELNSVLFFLQSDQVTYESSSSATVSELRASYEDFCKYNALCPLSVRAFILQLHRYAEQLGIHPVKRTSSNGKTVRGFEGLRVSNCHF